MISVFSFFSGLGLLDLGFESEGNYKTVFINEKEGAFMDAYLSNRKNDSVVSSREPIENFSSASKSSEYLKDLVISQKKKNLVGFVGGPPCPDFSVGGKNRGSKGENGILSLTYCNLILDQSPDWFLFENVKGLWRTKKHRSFYEELKSSFRANGYVLSEKLVNSLSYGVAQDRERIILVGLKEEIASGKLEYDSKNKTISEECFGWKNFEKYDADEVKKLPWPTVDRFGGEPNLLPGLPKDLTVNFAFQQNNVERHQNADCFFTPRAGLAKFKKIDEGDVYKKSYKRLHRWRYSPTAAYGNNEVHLHPYKARRLSVSEVLAIQSAPSSFQIPKEISLSAKFKMIGNGVPVKLALGLAKTIRKALL